MLDPAFNAALAQVSFSELQSCRSWQEKYKMLIDWGKQLPIQVQLRQSIYLVPGCDATLWLFHQSDAQGKHWFALDSDSHIMKGLAALLLQAVNGKTREEINNIDVELLVQEAGLKKHLSASRANGFNKIRERIVALTEEN